MPTGPKQSPRDRVLNLTANWLSAKHAVRTLTKNEKELNKSLSEFVEKDGFTDDRGHIWLELEAPVEGFDSKENLVSYNALQRQRRVSVVMDEEEAVAVCVRRQLYARCSVSYLQVTDVDAAIRALDAAGLLDGSSGIEVVTSIDESELRAAYFEQLISQQEYEEIFTEKVSYALLPGNL